VPELLLHLRVNWVKLRIFCVALSVSELAHDAVPMPAKMAGMAKKAQGVQRHASPAGRDESVHQLANAEIVNCVGEISFHNFEFR